MTEMQATTTTFPQRIRMARRHAALTQDELALALGCSSRAVQEWESGRRTPRPKLMRRLAEVTGREIAWFYAEAA
jgi:transcriptional regulator with XRE-family HTH domain